MWFKIKQHLNITIYPFKFFGENKWVIYFAVISIVSFLFYSSLMKVQSSKADAIPIEEQIKVYIEDNTILRGFFSKINVEVSECKIVIVKTYNRPCFSQTTTIESTRIIDLKDINVADPIIFSYPGKSPTGFIKWDFVEGKRQQIKFINGIYDKYLSKKFETREQSFESLRILNKLVENRMKEHSLFSKDTYLSCSGAPSIPDFSKPTIFLKNHTAERLVVLIKRYHKNECNT